MKKTLYNSERPLNSRNLRGLQYKPTFWEPNDRCLIRFHADGIWNEGHGNEIYGGLVIMEERLRSVKG